MRILEVAYHRNGCAGESFYAVRFSEGRTVMLALVFECVGGVMVLDPVKAATSVAVGENSWRGDLYEADLRKAIARFEAARTIRAAPSAGGSEALH